MECVLERENLLKALRQVINVRHVDSLDRTAVYVTRMYGGVGGGVP
jgi:hypothetical protein